MAISPTTSEDSTRVSMWSRGGGFCQMQSGEQLQISIGGRLLVHERLGRYAVELVILLVGLSAALLEALTVGRTDLGLLVTVVTVLLALAVMAIRQEIERQLVDATVDRRLLRQIPDADWQREAQAQLDQARANWASWASGQRRVPEASSLNYQIEAIRGTRRVVRAVHVALDPDALSMWDNPQRGFNRLVDAYRELGPGVTTRRILVLDAGDAALANEVQGVRKLVDPRLRRVCEAQMQPRADGGLGFELRLQFVDRGRRDLVDLLITDDRETCSINSFGNGVFGDLEACVDRAVVEARVRTFEDLWTDSVPASACL